MTVKLPSYTGLLHVGGSTFTKEGDVIKILDEGVEIGTIIKEGGNVRLCVLFKNESLPNLPQNITVQSKKS